MSSKTISSLAPDNDYPLNLPEFTVLERRELPPNKVLYIVTPKNPISRECPNCGNKLHIHKKSELKVRDLDEYGKEVGILIKADSYICKTCGNTVREKFPSIQKQMTTRLVEAIRRDSYREGTFTDVAKRYHVSPSKVQSTFEERGAEYLANYRLITPPVLGIDEVHLNNAYYGVYVREDVNNGRIIEISEERNKQAVIEVLKRMEEPENLRYVTMDMWRPYRDAVAQVFPNAPVIIDRFHVIKELQKCLDKIRSETCKTIANTRVRKSLKKNRFLLLSSRENLSPSNIANLNQLLVNYPQFEIPYILKESFRNIYAFATTKDEALAMFEEWVDECRKHGVTAYDSFIQTVYNWRPEIFAYFDFRGGNRTNAQTEGLNRSIRNLARDGRGYSFQNLRLKLLFGEKTPSSTRFNFNEFFLADWEDEDKDDD